MESGASSPDIKSPLAISSQTRWKWKTPVFALVVIFTNAFGNFFIARGMRALPALRAPADLIVAIFTPWVGLGIALLITWLLSRMMFLSFADLSYVLPLTSLGYVLSAVLGHVFLNEQITTQRWLGTGLIMMGTMLVGTGSTEAAHQATGPADAAAEVVEEVVEEIRPATEHSAAAAGRGESGMQPPIEPRMEQRDSNPWGHR